MMAMASDSSTAAAEGGGGGDPAAAGTGRWWWTGGGATVTDQTHPYYWCESHVWNAPACLATISLIFLFWAATLTMFKVIRSYSKKAERKHESSGGATTKGGYQNGSGGQYIANGGAHAGNGQLLAVDNRHLSHAQQAHHGFSESSSYETREHFERKVQKVKKSRGERERSRSARRGDEVSEILAGSDATSARDALLQWARKATAGYPRVNVTNFGSSWRDGLAFNAILHRYRPNLIDWNKISDPSVSNRERLENAFAAAEREFGVQRLLDAEDVDTNNPDEKSIITYVSTLYEALPHLPELSKDGLNDLISRLTRGIGITNEKLDIILQRIEEVERRVDTARPGEVERTVNEIVDELNALEHPIRGYFEDVEELKRHHHPEANDFYTQVYGLQQRRTAYLDRLTNQLLVKLGIRTESLLKENAARMESIRQSTFSRVEECIEWVRVRMEKLTEMEFLEDLETLEEMFEQHKLDNRDIQDFRQNVDECIARQAEVSAEDTYEYCDLLRVLESEYQQLRDLSAGRMLDLDSLIAFVRAAQMELVWVSEREEIEVTRNWSDIKQLDLPMLTNYYKQLLHEMELREKQYNDVHNQGAALLNQGHPAVHVIEVYLRTMQKQWDWLLSLAKCLEEHLRDALNLKSFMEEAADAESWMEEQAKNLEQNYNRTDFSLEEGERYLRELDEIKEILNKYHSVLMALTERCATISPLWQRGERITRPIVVTALCDYSDRNLHIKAGDDVTLLDNSDLIKWQIRDLSGTEGSVPSVVFRIPPPDTKLTAYLNRLLQQFEKLKRLWDKKHRMVRFNMVINTMKTIQGWDLDTFNAMDPEMRDAIMRALNDDANKLLSELDPNDPLALRLREELRKTNEHFWNLLNASQKPPEPDWASQFDERINDLLRKLEEAWRKLNDNVGKPVSRTNDELEKVIVDHKKFEDDLQALDGEVANVKELFRQLPNPTPTQRVNNDRLNGLWEDLWDLSRMYVERIKVLEAVLNGLLEVNDIVKQHEITLNSFDDLPAALDKLRGHHAQLLEMNMVLQQQQSVIDALNKNAALLRQHVARTRINQSSHPDVDRLEEEVQQLNVRWENVRAQVVDRVKAAERATQIQAEYRPAYDNEIAWLDRVEETINRLRKPEELRPEEYQKELDMLAAEYAALQERTEAIEFVNREGGKFIREAKGFDSRMGQYQDAVVGIHGPGIKNDFRRTKPQPKNGAQIVTEELEALNRRFAQLSSLILERKNNMQVLIQNWKRQKQDEAVQEASSRHSEVSLMLSDLDNFKSNVFTECFSIHLSPDSASQATSNIQNIKDSLDAWRDSVKTRLDEIDALCREQRDNLPPEQYSELREARHKLAANYDNVVRTVEGIYGRLNVITVLLLEFSTAASSTQSWITDCTRSAGDIKAKSADAAQFSKQYREAQLLLEKVQGGETRLKEIGGIVRKLEHEIGLLYDESPMGTPRTLNADEVNQTFGRVQSDFETLLKMCQELQQFQNRLSVLEGELMDRSRALDDHLVNVENNLSDFDQSRGMGADSKMKTVVQLQSKARETEPKLDLYEQSTHRLLSHLEGSGAAEDIREAKQADVARAKKRHNSLVGQLQDRMNRVNVELAENEGVKEAVASLLGWTKDFERKLSVPTILPLNEKDLHGLKNDCQLSQSELESRQVVLGQLEKAAERMDGDRLQADLTEAKQRMGKAGILLKGLRDNLNDALAGEQSFTLGCENLSRSCDLLQNSLKTTQPRDTQRLLDCEEDLAGLAGAVDSLESTAGMLKAIPNTSGVEQMDHRVRDFKRRLTELGRDLAAKRSRNSEAANLEKQIQQLRQDTAEWLGNFDGELLELGPVSVDQQRLGQQRRQCSELAEKHRDGLGLMEELEGALALLGEAEGAAGSRNSSVPRHLIDLMTRLNGQADLLRNRLDKINENEKKAAELDEAKRDVEGWIAAQNAAIESLPTPAGKDELQQVNGQIDKIEKSVRQERRKVEDVHLKTRELARRASLPNEAESLLREDEGLESRWNEMQDRVEAKTDRNKRVGQLLDGCGQLEKWLGTKEKMMLALGAPSTEPAVSRSQLAQLQIIKSEAEGEQPTLEALLENAEELAEGDRHAEGLLDRIKTLQRRWKSLDEGLLGKEEAIKTTDGLSHDIKKLQKEIKSRLGEIESSLDTTAHSQSGDIEKQLNSLEDLRLQHKDLNEVVKDLEEKLKQTEEMEIDPANRDEIEEQVQKTKRRVTELGQKIEGTKTAVLTALNEGAAVDEQLNALLAVVRSAAADVQQFPPIVADPSKLAEQLTAVNTLHNGLLTKETEVPVVKALVAKQLKKKHDPELKSKCDELTKAWGPLLVATLDRKSAVEKADDLIKQFTDGEKSLSHRLQDDEKEIEAVVASEEGEAVLQALQAVENVLTRRSADAEGLIGLVDRIEQVAPGPDANKLKRKAENLLDDCKTLSRKAKNAAGESKKRADLRARIERLLSEAKDHASSQENLLKNPENINKERIGPQIAEVADFWTRKRRDLSNCEGEAKEARVDSVLLEEELPKLDIRFENILARLNDHAHSIAEKQSAAQRVVDHAAGEARKVDDLNNEVSDLEPPAHCLEELRGQKEQCQDLIRAVEEERGRVTGAEEEVESAVEDGTISRQQHDSAKSQLDNAEKVLARCQKRLEQRERKIDQAAAEVEDFDRESKELSAELAKLLDPLQAPIEVADLKKQSTELKQLKEAVKPLADRVDAFSSDCKILIKAAGPEAKTTELDEALQRVSAAWSEVSSALADKEMKVDSAAQELGRYEDAYKNLLNWLEDSEELLENQEKPSVDAKAAKLQLATYNLMMKHIEDKEASVSGFNALIDKLVNLAPTEAEKAGLKDKADGISKRYQRLLSEAQDRQARVIDAIDLAERLGEVMTPLAAWLGKTEKRVQALSNIATASAKMEEQLAVQKDLEEEVDQKADDLAVMDSLVPLLSALVSVKDAEELEDQANRLGNSYDGLAQRVHSIRGLLADVANQVGDFEHDTNALAAWLDEMEARLLDVDELAIEPDDLLEQSNILTDLAQAVTERDALVSNVVSVGKVLCKQTTTDEAIALQNRIEVLKNRYVDIMAVADDKLAHLSKAIPLSERFHEGFEVVIQWVEAVEEDLQNIDEADISTQAQLVFTLEEDVQNWRPEVEDLVAVSNQLQALSSRDRAEELYQNTVEMNRRVNQIADKVSRRAERLDVTEKQSRAVLDDLEFIVEWLADAKERLLTADPPSIDPEFLNRQLKNQKIMNEDVTLNKGKLRDVITEAKKIARQIGADAPDSPACAALNEKCDVGKELVDEVSNLCMERTEHLERAKVLAEQLTLEFEELSLWLDNLEDELRTAPDVNTTTPQAELQRMNLHNSELMAAVIAYQPIINTFDKDVKAMVEVCHEKEGEKLRELADELLDRYKEIAEAVRARGHGIDSVMDTTSVFEERLCKLVENLEGAADRLRETGGAMSADPVVLENKLAENAAILENLGSKKAAYSHLKEDAAALLASAPEGDVAAQDVMSKLGRLEKLWADIEQEATLRGELLSDVLGKAKHFWAELDDCQQAVDNLRYRLEAVEPATGQPQQLQLQQQQLASVAADLSSTGPRIAALKQAGDELSSRIPPEEQDVVRTQVDAIQTGWATITNLFADKNRDLIQAMEEAMTFHGDLNDLLGWLDGAEQHLALMPPAESLKIDEIPAALDELRLFKDDVDQHGVLKEQLAQTAAALAEGAPAAQAAVVRQPINELNLRWSKLYGAMAEREHKVEMALLQMGKLSEAAGQLIDWIDRSRATATDLASNSTPRNLRNVEIQICKLAVLKNDVDAHRPSVDTLNAAARRLLKDGSDSTAAGKIDEMNSKWLQLNEQIGDIGIKMDKAKSEAESVGGELERWLSWLDDVEQQLATTRPTGGLPETAQTQMDDFRVLRAEIEQNSPALEEYLKETSIYLLEHGNDQDSWIGRSHNQMKTKWTKVKELCQDREKKLQLALDDAIALDDAMRDTADWLQSAETSLTQLEPVSHVLERAEKQHEELEAWKAEVAKRKQLMAEQQAAGRRLQVYCEKKDAIPIKNGLVSLKHRFEKVQARTNERGKLLAVAMEEARVWLNGVEQVEDCLFRVEEALTMDAPSTSNVDRLKEHLNEVKDLQKAMAETQPYYEVTKKRGSLLAEKSTKPEARQINARNNEMAARWTALTRKCVERQRAAEQAVLEGGAFDEAMKELEDWIDLELHRTELPDYQKVHGDVETVHGLRDEENHRTAERLAKKKGVNTLLKKADELLTKGVDESEAVGRGSERLKEKWSRVEEAAGERDRALSQAESDAADFDAKAHGILDYLAAIEQKLKEPVKDLSLALSQVTAVKGQLDKEMTRRDECLALGKELAGKCHPRAEQSLKHWTRVVDGRWKEVEERCAEREFVLLEEEQKEAERDTQLKELHDFIRRKKDELARMTSSPMAIDLEALEKMEKEYEGLDFDLRERQPDVDNAVKSARKGVNDPRGNQMQNEWKQLWLDSLGYHQALENQRALLEEMKRLEGWKWEQWKDRYVDWNDHGKARVSDLFRRIDRSHTGNVPRNVFIDAIIASRFPTSRLEMDKVADLFDKGDGLINSKEFINALRFDIANRAKPVTDTEKINVEIEKQRNSCSCCNTYRIEKISDNHYKFGDTEIKRMVRILRSTVMVRVGGGWEPLDVFLGKHDPCRANNRTNIKIYKELAPAHAIDTMAAFTKNRSARTSSISTPGPIMKVREKTERSMPMFPRHERAGSDLSSGESKIPRPSLGTSRSSLADSSRPPSRAGSEAGSDSHFQTRIPSLRGKKGSRYMPPPK